MNSPAFTEMSGGGNGGPAVTPATDGTRGGGGEKMTKALVIVSGRVLPFIFRFRQAFTCTFINAVRAGILYTPPFLFRVGGQLVTR